MKQINIEESEVNTQASAILWHLGKYGSITSYEAIKEYGATRLASIIFNYRKEGYTIDSMPLQKKNRFGRTVTISKYIYVKPVLVGTQSRMF